MSQDMAHTKLGYLGLHSEHQAQNLLNNHSELSSYSKFKKKPLDLLRCLSQPIGLLFFVKSKIRTEF